MLSQNPIGRGKRIAMVGLCLLVGVFELSSDGHGSSSIRFSIGSVAVKEAKMQERGHGGLGALEGPMLWGLLAFSMVTMVLVEGRKRWNILQR